MSGSVSAKYTTQGQLIKVATVFLSVCSFAFRYAWVGPVNLLAIIYQKSSTDTKRTVLSALIVSNKTTYLLEDKSQLADMESGNRQTRAWSPYCRRH